jgi:voltage-gated potassium channel Kch
MVSKLLAAWGLMALCVAVHAIGVTWAVRWIQQRAARIDQFRQWTLTFIHVAAWVIVLHLLAISAWGLFYHLTSAVPDLQSALYFSAVTYTTTGYGDVVLPREWQLVGAVEALTGILMCGLSTGFFFAVVSSMIRDRPPRV